MQVNTLGFIFLNKRNPFLWKIRKEPIVLPKTVPDLGNRKICNASRPGNYKSWNCTNPANFPPGLHTQSYRRSLQCSINGGLINIRNWSKRKSHQHTWKRTWCVWNSANYKLIQHRLHIQGERDSSRVTGIVLVYMPGRFPLTLYPLPLTKMNYICAPYVPARNKAVVKLLFLITVISF